MKKTLIVPALIAGSLSQNALAAFVEDSKVNLNLRNFYLNNDVRNESAASLKDWGQAGVLDYRSGFTEGTLGFGVDLLGQYALRLDGGGINGKAGVSRQPGSSFPLETDNSGVTDFSRLGATGKLRLGKTVLQTGTLLPKLPILTYSDTRLLPQAFEGTQITSADISNLTLLAGHIEHVSDRNSSDRTAMSIAGSNSATGQTSNAFDYAGADYQLSPQLQARYYYATLDDFYGQHFAGLTHNLALPAGKLTTDLRYFDSNSEGANSSAAGRADGYLASGYFGVSAKGKAISKGEVDNRLWSALLSYSLSGHTLSAGYQASNGNSDFPHVNQGNGRTLYLISNAQLGKFASAGENTWVAGYAYDFASLGAPGLKASAQYFSGSNIDDNVSAREEWERNLRIDYQLQSTSLKGLGLSWRNAVWRGNDVGQKDQDENLLTASYSLPLR